MDLVSKNFDFTIMELWKPRVPVFSTVLTPDKSIFHMWAWFSICGMAFPCAEMGEKDIHRS